MLINEKVNRLDLEANESGSKQILEEATELINVILGKLPIAVKLAALKSLENHIRVPFGGMALLKSLGRNFPKLVSQVHRVLLGFGDLEVEEGVLSFLEAVVLRSRGSAILEDVKRDVLVSCKIFIKSTNSDIRNRTKILILDL